MRAYIFIQFFFKRAVSQIHNEQAIYSINIELVLAKGAWQGKWRKVDRSITLTDISVIKLETATVQFPVDLNLL